MSGEERKPLQGPVGEGGDRVVGCVRCREILSTRLDGEATTSDEAWADEHLRGCAGCRGYDDRIADVTRRFRLRGADPTPDLVDVVLARAAGVTGDPDSAPLAHIVGTVVPAAMCGCDPACRCGCQDGRACRCERGVA